MDRRSFLALGTAAGLHGLKSLHAASAAGITGTSPASKDTQVADVPYGANRLNDTDENAFKVSVLQQWKNANIPPPHSFDPFPSENHGDPLTKNGTNSFVRGESKQAPLIGKLKEDLNTFYPSQPGCDHLDIEKDSAALRTVWAYHETAHWTAMGLVDQGKLDLISAYDPFRGEKVADAATTLYVLSNYQDRVNTNSVLNKLVDVRLALYTDPRSDDGSAVRAAQESFAKNPRRHLTMPEAVLRADKLMLTHDLHNEKQNNEVRDVLHRIMDGREPSGKSPEQIKKFDEDIQKIIEARNRACRPSP